MTAPLVECVPNFSEAAIPRRSRRSGRPSPACPVCSCSTSRATPPITLRSLRSSAPEAVSMRLRGDARRDQAHRPHPTQREASAHGRHGRCAVRADTAATMDDCGRARAATGRARGQRAADSGVLSMPVRHTSGAGLLPECEGRVRRHPGGARWNPTRPQPSPRDRRRHGDRRAAFLVAFNVYLDTQEMRSPRRSRNRSAPRARVAGVQASGFIVDGPGAGIDELLTSTYLAAVVFNAIKAAPEAGCGVQYSEIVVSFRARAHRRPGIVAGGCQTPGPHPGNEDPAAACLLPSDRGPSLDGWIVKLAQEPRRPVAARALAGTLAAALVRWSRGDGRKKAYRRSSADPRDPRRSPRAAGRLRVWWMRCGRLRRRSAAHTRFRSRPSARSSDRLTPCWRRRVLPPEVVKLGVACSRSPRHQSTSGPERGERRARGWNAGENPIDVRRKT